MFRKADRFPSSNNTWTVQNSLNNVDVCLLGAFVRLCATSHGFKKQGIILTLLLIVLAFLNIVQ